MTGRGTIETINKMLGCIDAFRASPPCDCNCHSCERFASAEEKKEAMVLAISALEKQEWHNARKDPPKRPDNMWDTYYVYTRFDRYGVARYYAHGKWDGYDEDGDRIEEYEIIAYCNFKPYTEEDNEKP